MASKRRSVLTRREFLRATALAGAAFTIPSWIPSRSIGASTPGRVVVVGAGLAGLTAAWRLTSKFRIPCDLYEARDRVGGRVWTERGLDGGQWIERGGQFISTGDRRLRRLARELGLGFLDLGRTYPGGERRLRFGGAFVEESALASDLAAVEAAAYAHYDEVIAPATWDWIDAATSAWDNVSVEEWLDEACPGGLSSTVAGYLQAYFESEYAGPIADASALMMIYDFGLPAGGFDERYSIDGGNDLLATTMAAGLAPGSLHLERPLLSAAHQVDGSILLTFDTGGAPLEVETDVLILALPFSTLRDVDTSGLLLDDRKRDAIDALQVGFSSKASLRFTAPVWEPAFNGESYSDLATGPTFPSHPGQPGTTAILTSYGCPPATAGPYAAEAAHGAPSPAALAAVLADVDAVFPGAAAAYDGYALLDHWPADPWVKGSYSYYRTGQFTAFAGIEAEPEGNVFFAGEHTARYKSRATMNGAVESGEAAARLARRAARRT